MTSLIDIKADIESLESEILQLEKTYEQYTQHLDNLKINGNERSSRNKRRKTSGTQENTPHETSKTQDIDVTPPRSHLYTPFDEIIVPPPLEHEFFDVSIMDFFEPAKNSSNLLLVSLSKQRKKEEEEEKERSKNLEVESGKQLLEHINYENLYRLNGVTLFCINNPSITDSTKFEDLKQLGLRFDLFETKSQKFKMPHYIILQKSEKNDMWEVFKKTIPQYIELDSKWLNIDLYQFVHNIRRQLLRLSEVDVLTKTGALSE